MPIGLAFDKPCPKSFTPDGREFVAWHPEFEAFAGSVRVGGAFLRTVLIRISGHGTNALESN